MNRICNEHVRGTAQVYRFEKSQRGKAGLGMCRRVIVDILNEGYLIWSYQAGGKEGDPREDSWV